MLNIRDLGRIVDGCPDSSMEPKKEYMKISYNGEKILELTDNCIRIKPNIYNKLDKYMKYYIESTYTVNTVEEVDRTRGFMRINSCDVDLIIDIINKIIEKLR